MKKKMLSIALGLCVALSGCAEVNETLEQKMLEQAGISADSNYQTYLNYEADGKLTQQGYYSEAVFEAELDAETSLETTALVSFAQNSCLYVNYFADANHTVPIDTQSGYFKPGTTIYATVELSRDVASSMYSFTEFRLYKYQRGGRDQIDTIELGEDGFVLKITEDMIGGDYSLEPVGNYETRIITLRDYYKDEDGKERELLGDWMIDNENIAGDKAEISPVASYIISYEYDNDEYFFISSAPKCFYCNHDDGIVIFELTNATDESYEYSVEMGKYLSFDVMSKVARTIKDPDDSDQNENSGEVVGAGAIYTFKRLQYGDVVKFCTESEWPELKTCMELVVIETQKSTGQYEYEVTIPDRGTLFWFDPDEYTAIEHGEITFYWYGEEITEPIEVATGHVITYSAARVDDGYWLDSENCEIVIGSEEETKAALNSIQLQTAPKVTVNLPQPEYGGTITYYADGKQLTGSTFITTAGTIISMDFQAWPGWVNVFKDGETYEVDGNSDQYVKIQGESIETKGVSNDAVAVFVEDPAHMPTLEVVLNKSVGENMNFTISAAGLAETECKYSGNWYNSNVTVLPAEESDIKIGTHESIYLEFGNRALEAGTAVKVQVEMETRDGNKISYYRLIDDLTEKQKPIDIYSDSEMGVSTVWYKSVKITVSIVEVKTFTAPKKPTNGTVVVRVADTQAVLETGDLIEPTTEVTVTITPANDYYVTGKSVQDDIYQSKMKFSKYLDNIDDIISEHPIEKYIHLTLTADDKYGTCTYKLDKTVVSGKIRAKVGQELTLTYTVTANGYVIEGGSGGFWGIGKTDTEKSATIAITADMNGKTIDRASFEINVVKG